MLLGSTKQGGIMAKMNVGNNGVPRGTNVTIVKKHGAPGTSSGTQVVRTPDGRLHTVSKGSTR